MHRMWIQQQQYMHVSSLHRLWNNGSGRRKLLMVCLRATPMDEHVPSDADAPVAPPMPELQPEFDGEDVNRQLERFSRFTMSRTRGPAEALRIMQVGR